MTLDAPLCVVQPAAPKSANHSFGRSTGRTASPGGAQYKSVAFTNCCTQDSFDCISTNEFLPLSVTMNRSYRCGCWPLMKYANMRLAKTEQHVKKLDDLC